MKKLLFILFCCIIDISVYSQSISQIQFWYDGNYAAKTDIYTPATANYTFAPKFTNTTSLSEGLHDITFRARDNNGKWSSAIREFFYKKKPDSIIGYEYWFDNNYASVQSASVTKDTQAIVIKNFPTNIQDNNLHTFNIRFKSKNGKWSVVTTNFVIRKFDVKLVAYEYWFKNGYASKRITKPIDPNSDYLVIDKLDISSLGIGSDTVYFRTQDNQGKWSSVIAKSINNTYNFITYPTISLSKTELKQGEKLFISGSNFSSTYTDNITIKGTDFLIQLPFTTNLAGSFTIEYTIGSEINGGYMVSTKDDNRKFPVPPMFYNVKNQVVTSSTPTLEIISPKATSYFDNGFNNKIRIEWTDYVKYIPAQGGQYTNRNYKLEYSVNGSSWVEINTVSKKLVLTDVSMFSYDLYGRQAGSYKFRISDLTYGSQYNQVESEIIVVQNVSNNLFTLMAEWDYSGNRPANIAPEAICADGTARIVLNLARLEHLDFKIKSIKAQVFDPINTTITDPTLLGKIKYSDNAIVKYDLSGDLAQNTFDVYVNNSNDNKSDYYFWYVAPDNFVRNQNDSFIGERPVNIVIEVTLDNNAKYTYTKQIKVLRPPLMLVHGWMSNENTWDNFMYQDGNKVYKYKDAHHLFKAGIRRNNMLKSNAYLDNGLILVSQFLPNSFAYQIEQARIKGIACNKVDYICHSMGGCMVRTAINMYPNDYNPPETSPLKFKNYGKGFTNKVITINTPHNGSTGADLINEQLPKMNYAKSILLSALYDFSDFAQHIYQPNGWNPKNPLHLLFKPSSAVSNMQFKNSDIFRGGVRFSETKGIKGFMIASKFSESENDAVIKSDLMMNNIGYMLYDILTKDDNYNSSHNLVTYVNRKMTDYGINNFMSNSDFVVPITSQLIDGSLTDIKKYHKLFNGDNSMHTDIHSRLDVGNFCLYKLNDDIKSDRFTNSFPKNDSSGGIRHKSATIKPTDSTLEKYNDTTKYKLLNSIASLNYIDSTIAIQINVKDTNKLLANTIVFQGQMYFNKLEKGNLLYLLKVNPNYIDSQLLVTTLTYDSAGYNVHYKYDLSYQDSSTRYTP